MHLLKPVPGWVIVTFFIFMAYGLSQFRARQVRPARLVILPVLIILLTLAGVITGSLSRPLGLVSWLIGLGIPVWLGKLAKASHRVHYSYQTKLLHLPGSRVPLLLMLLIYATLYAVHDMKSYQNVFMSGVEFSITIGLIYGVIAGMFLARMFSAWRVKRQRLNDLIG